MLVARHPVGVAIVTVALALTAAVFVFARPQYHDPNRGPTFDMRGRHDLLTVQQVRTAFAAQGIRLDHGGPMCCGSGGGWVAMLSAIPAPVSTAHVQVFVVGPAARGSFGAKQPGYDARFRNVVVQYDGPSSDVLRRARAAVADLKG